MPNSGTIGIVGSDGVVPVYNPEGRWTIWGKSDVYLGGIGTKKYVPNLHDYVLDYDTYTTYMVTHIDPVTLIPTLVEKTPAVAGNTFSNADILQGVGPGTQADTYRVYINNSVLPYTLAVDSRLKIAGSMSSYAKIFKGNELGNDAVAVSKVYDSNGNFISENIPLELIALDNITNYSIKQIAVCNCVDNLLDGEVVTAVIYNDQGHVVSKRQLLVENTSFIRSINSSVKYITGISLECNFMSPTDPNLIQFPLNVPINALNLIGVVNYSDGSNMKLPVDGTKFTMFGLDQYSSTLVGQEFDIALSYTLGSNETSYAGSSGHITEPYRLVTVNPNNSYTVKLYPYPVWINANVGYQLKWYLLNLDRNIFFDVSQHVTTNHPFNPTGYGFVQRLTASLNLRNVSGAFKPFIHVQVVDISLNGIPSAPLTPWLVANESVASTPSYGNGLYAKKQSNGFINLNSNIADILNWTDRVYEQSYPLINRLIEQTAPIPTHFLVMTPSTIVEFPIADWNVDLNIGPNININDTVFIKFIKRTASGDMILSVAAMIVYP